MTCRDNKRQPTDRVRSRLWIVAVNRERGISAVTSCNRCVMKAQRKVFIALRVQETDVCGRLFALTKKKWLRNCHVRCYLPSPFFLSPFFCFISACYMKIGTLGCPAPLRSSIQRGFPYSELLSTLNKSFAKPVTWARGVPFRRNYWIDQLILEFWHGDKQSKR